MDSTPQIESRLRAERRKTVVHVLDATKLGAVTLFGEDGDRIQAVSGKGNGWFIRRLPDGSWQADSKRLGRAVGADLAAVCSAIRELER